MISFFDNKLSRENSAEDVGMRSRSVSSASNNSLQNYLKGHYTSKKYSNLYAMDGFAMMERDEEEDKYNIHQTVLKGMDVEGICADIGEQNSKNYHLDKLFNPQGPYFTQTQLFEQEKRNKSKRRNKKKPINPQQLFLNRIDSKLYRDDFEDTKNYGIATLFEDPVEKEVRMAELINRNKKKKWT